MPEKEQKIGCVIMASGLSERYGKNKLLEKLEGKGCIYGLDIDPIESKKTTERLRSAGFDEDIFKFRLTNFENIDKVAAITEQLGSIKNTILSAVSDLSAVSEETSATNQEVSATTETVAQSVVSVSDDMTTMTGLADDLKKSVAFFKQ